MERGRAAVENLLDEGGKGSASGPVLGEGGNLLLSGNLTGEEKPEKTLRKRLGSTGSFGEEFLAFGNGLSAEANTLLCEQKISILYVKPAARHTSVKN